MRRETRAHGIRARESWPVEEDPLAKEPDKVIEVVVIATSPGSSSPGARLLKRAEVLKHREWVTKDG